MRASRRCVLGIETSCDETSASVVTGDSTHPELRSLVILSQDVHRLFGGVVPEIASRQHLVGIVPTVQAALDEAGVTLDDVEAIAVTHAPGLVGALLVGTSYAKALGYASGVPVVPVHHLEGHLFATLLEHQEASPPFTALLVSGGHTMLLDVPAWGSYRLLGQTRDDAAGEAFDKVAKLLGLPYPGGRPLEELARTVESSTVRFVRPMVRAKAKPGDEDYFDLSFSGLKTAVLLAVRAAEKGGTLETSRASIARAFQDAVVDTLVEKVDRAVRLYRRKRVVLGGGVACNVALQRAMGDRLERRGGRVFAPSPRLATDNAAMIAAAGMFRFELGERADPTLTAHASLPLPGLAPATLPTNNAQHA
ncbi:MAG: tRNA (adenosine(37)-N6)-threonylcarbamoyltransferase complex transferase subunit TsaD [Gemmatimonadaceae bacterium]|nr:tRNA (adenosine(37)-N6)-threonylcarbamoyltransferase complex transferase subunit TsaD [Gemmatimonadaceae bacterium]